MPMAASPSSAAWPTISCGCEAPRRNEKLVAAASSAKLFMQTSRVRTIVGLRPARKGPRGRARSGGPAHPRRGSSRVCPRPCSATIQARCAPAPGLGQSDAAHHASGNASAVRQARLPARQLARDAPAEAADEPLLSLSMPFLASAEDEGWSHVPALKFAASPLLAPFFVCVLPGWTLRACVVGDRRASGQKEKRGAHARHAQACGSVRMMLSNGIPAEALLQPVDQPHQLVRRGTVFMNTQGSLPFGQALGIAHVHGRGLKAEVRLELVAQTIKTQTDQLGDMLRIATGRRKPKL